MGGADSNAIDCDNSATNGLIQYNYVYGNGDGFLLCGVNFSTAVWRYNIIQNNSGSRYYINHHGDSGYNYVHNNLFYNTLSASSLTFIGTSGTASSYYKTSNPLYAYNNIFYNASEQTNTAILVFDWDYDRNLRSDRGNEYY
jgi:hypothetical protein